MDSSPSAPQSNSGSSSNYAITNSRPLKSSSTQGYQTASDQPDLRYILDPDSTQAAATPPSTGKLLSDYLLFSPSGTLQADTQTANLATTANQAAVSTSTFHKILSGLGAGFTQELSQQWNSLKSLQTEMAMSINGSSDSAMNASLGNRSLYELAQVTPDEPPLITKQDLIDIYTDFKTGDAYSRSVMVGKGGALVSEAIILKRIGLFEGEAVEGEVFGVESNVPGTGLPAKSLDNVTTRKWYLQQLSDIPNKIDKTLSLREQGLQEFKMRNDIKLQARQLMSDQVAAEQLPPPETLRSIVLKNYREGNVGDNLWKAIMGSATRTNREIDSSLGINNPYNTDRYRP